MVINTLLDNIARSDPYHFTLTSQIHIHEYKIFDNIDI